MRGALAHLSPEIDDVDAALDELLFRDLVVREARATISGEQAFKFKHVLIREVAYAGLSKSSRADLHHAFAEWLGERAGDELLEIRAFHLDQAARLLDGARRRRAGRARRGGGRRRSRRPGGARSRASRSAARASCCCAPSSSRRRSSAATSPRVRRGASPTCRPSSSRWRRSRRRPSAAGETQLQGRALTALAEAVLYQRADAVRRARLDRPRRSRCSPTSRPRSASSRSGSRRRSPTWLGDYEEFERWAKLALAAAREAGAEGPGGDRHARRSSSAYVLPARVRRGGAAPRARRSSSPTRAAASSAAAIALARARAARELRAATTPRPRRPSPLRASSTRSSATRLREAAHDA